MPFDPSPASPRRAAGRLVVPAILCAVLVAHALVWPGAVRDELTREVCTETDDAARAAEARGGEVLRLRWKLGGFLGVLAGLFVPSSGDAVLTFVPSSEAEILDIELLITAPKREGEYFLYGAAIDRKARSTAEVWSSYRYRDKHKEREQDVEQPDVIDFASVIYHLRWYASEQTERMTIWSDGKTYPVEVQPLGAERRKIAGEKIDVRGYLVRGVKQDGGDSFDDKFWLYFARDENATPVEIVGKRGFVRLKIQMEERSGAAIGAPGTSDSIETRVAEPTRPPAP